MKAPPVPDGLLQSPLWLARRQTLTGYVDASDGAWMAHVSIGFGAEGQAEWLEAVHDTASLRNVVLAKINAGFRFVDRRLCPFVERLFTVPAFARLI